MRLISGLLLVNMVLFSACAEDKKFAGTATSQVDQAEKEPEVTANIEPEPEPAPAPAPVPPPAPVVPAEEPPEDVDTSIEFGADEVFHIGDGALSASSACANEIDTVDLTGNTFFFEFEVLNDDTEVELSVGKICGVDYNGDRLSLINSESKEKLEDLVVPRDSTGITANGWDPFPSVKLAKGLYSIVVASKVGSRGAGETPGDFDDFLVGKINVKADKQVRAVRIFTE